MTRYATRFAVIDGRSYNAGDIIPALDTIQEVETALANSREEGAATVAPAKKELTSEALKPASEVAPVKEEETPAKTDADTEGEANKVVEENEAPAAPKTGFFGGKK